MSSQLFKTFTFMHECILKIEIKFCMYYRALILSLLPGMTANFTCSSIVEQNCMELTSQETAFLKK